MPRINVLMDQALWEVFENQAKDGDRSKPAQVRYLIKEEEKRRRKRNK